MANQTIRMAGDELAVLQDFRWPEGLVTSCYLGVDGRTWPNRDALITQLNSMLSRARAGLEKRQVSHEGLVSARKDLDNLEQWLHVHLNDRDGAVSLAWFGCSRHNIQVARWLPIGLPNRLIFAEDFDEGRLLGAINSIPRVGLVVIDHGKARYITADMAGVTELPSDEAPFQEKIRVPERTVGRFVMQPDAQFGRGNLAEKRLQNRRNHLMQRHVSGVVRRLERLQREHDWTHLLIAGERHAVKALRDSLSSRLRRLPIQEVDMPMKAGTAEVKKVLWEKVEDLRRERFEQEYRYIVNDLVPELRAVRLPEVLRAATLDGIQLLLLDSHDARDGRLCPECGWLGLEGEQCPVCTAKLSFSPHIYDNLADAVLAGGGEVLFSERPLLPPNAEHAVARLRFPLTEGL